MFRMSKKAILDALLVNFSFSRVLFVFIFFFFGFASYQHHANGRTGFCIFWDLVFILTCYILVGGFTINTSGPFHIMGSECLGHGKRFLFSFSFYSLKNAFTYSLTLVTHVTAAYVSNFPFHVYILFSCRSAFILALAY